jgi:hypothetical protein
MKQDLTTTFALPRHIRTQAHKIRKGAIEMKILIGALSLFVIYLLIDLHGLSPTPGVPLDGRLSEVQSRSITISLQLTELIISWSVAVIGGTAYFLKSAFDSAIKLSNFGIAVAEMAIILAITSVFFGQMTITAQLNMLSLDIYSSRDEALTLYGSLQFFFFLASLLVFMLFSHFAFRDSSKTY